MVATQQPLTRISELNVLGSHVLVLRYQITLAALFAGQKPEGQITEVSGYLFPRPSDPKPVCKNSFFTKVGDLFCGVGYYK
jgi:hypothetical protein